MDQTVSIAIETTCRAGGVAVGVGDRLRDTIRFDAASRHATHLVSRLQDLLRRAGVRPADVGEVYVSAGPGSFTGTRVGVIVARTMGQLSPLLRCVAVPTPEAVAHGARDLPWEHLAVILDARQKCLWAQRFTRKAGQIVPDGAPQIATPEEFLAAAPRPLLLIGEGLAHHDLHAPDVRRAPESLHLPAAENVWQIGRRMAGAGQFVDFHQLLPAYVRQPEAVRARQGRPD